MANYDEPIYFDSGVCYDESPNERRSIRMSQIKSGMSRLSDQELANTMQVHEDAMSGKPKLLDQVRKCASCYCQRVLVLL